MRCDLETIQPNTVLHTAFILSVDSGSKMNICDSSLFLVCIKLKSLE